MPKKKTGIESESEFIRRIVGDARSHMRRSRDLADPQFEVQGIVGQRLAPRAPASRSGSFVVDKTKEFFAGPGGVEFDVSGTSLPEYEESFLAAVRDARTQYRKKHK